MSKDQGLSDLVVFYGGRLDPPRLVKLGGDGRIAVTVSHIELGNLVGRLMQMCDLIGDVEQRNALKSTIKQISREWLDENYRIAGYDKHEVNSVVEVLDGTKVS